MSSRVIFRRPHLLPLLVALVGGCTSASELSQDVDQVGALYALVEADEGVHFYMPLGPEPVVPVRAFDPSLLGGLQVELHSAGADGDRVDGTFAAETTPALVLLAPHELYFVNVPAARYFTDPSRAYRFLVFLRGRLIARSDMTDHIFTVLRWVPQVNVGVKLRIEVPAPVCGDPQHSACVDGDDCCPRGCNAVNDADCLPACGNGVAEPGETCDGDCPASCDDGVACTTDAALGSAASCNLTCVHQPVTHCVSGDGCCPEGCNANTDGDCSPTCGNGVVEAGETCDGSCPASCSDGNSCTIDTPTGSAASCSAACSHRAITECTSGDGCCPAGCSYASDTDCPLPAIAWRWITNMNNGRPYWDGGSGVTNGSTLPTPAFSKGGSDWGFIVDFGQTYSSWTSVTFRFSAASGTTSSLEGCVSNISGGCYQGTGNPSISSGALVLRPSDFTNSPVGSTSGLTSGSLRYVGFGNGDGGSTISITVSQIELVVGGTTYVWNASTGGPTCGNGIVDSGETCDGNCPTSCGDGNSCTTDVMTGSAGSCNVTCTHQAITACTSGDGCCPSGCTAATDTDCSATTSWRWIDSMGNGRPYWDGGSGVTNGTALPTPAFSKSASDWGFIVDFGQTYSSWTSVTFRFSSASGTTNALEGCVSNVSSGCYQGTGSPSISGGALVLRPSDFTSATVGSPTGLVPGALRYIGFGNGDGGSTISIVVSQIELVVNGTTYTWGSTSASTAQYKFGAWPSGYGAGAGVTYAGLPNGPFNLTRGATSTFTGTSGDRCVVVDLLSIQQSSSITATQSGSNYFSILTSTDGTTWTTRVSYAPVGSGGSYSYSLSNTSHRYVAFTSGEAGSIFTGVRVN